jgi:hypothetical protein
VTVEVLYSIVYLLGALAEFVLLGVLLFRRQYKSFPVFTAYIAFNVVSDVLVAVLRTATSGRSADWAALSLLPLEYLLELGVLCEIAWHVLKPVRASLPPKAIRAFLLLVLIALAGGVLLAGHADLHGGGIYEKIKYPLDLTVGMLRMLLFAAIAAFAQALGIGWRDKVLQLATGLCFYSALDLIASLLQSHFGQVQAADHIKVAAYMLELAFFVWVFTTKDVERREFSPQMREILVTISGRARDARAVIARSQVK